MCVVRCWQIVNAENNKTKIKLSTIAKLCNISVKAVKRVAYKGLKKGELVEDRGCWFITPSNSLLQPSPSNSINKGDYARRKAKLYIENINSARQDSDKKLFTKKKNVFSIDLFNLGTAGCKERPFLNWVNCLSKA
eukprot:g4439.t1